MAKRKPLFGIDIDGVLYKWGETARFLLNYYFNLTLQESDSWDYLKNNITKEQWAWLWTTGVKKGLFRSGHVYKGSIESLHKLSAIGDITLITSRPPNAYNDTFDWIAFHRVPTTSVTIVGPDRPKSTVLPHCDMYVDDKADNCIDLQKNTLGEVLLWSRPWNCMTVHDLSRTVGIDRVKCWEEVIARAEKIADNLKKE